MRSTSLVRTSSQNVMCAMWSFTDHPLCERSVSWSSVSPAMASRKSARIVRK